MSLKKIKLFIATLAIAASLSLNSTPAITLTYSAAGSAGSPTLNIEPTTVVPKPDSHGSFRIVCRYSHANYDDAILKPGQPGASHLHIYFGNTKTNAYTIYSSLSTSGNGTCHGGIANRSSYWIPAMIDTAKNEVKIPRDFIVYYKSYAPDTVVKPPNGIKLLVGNPMATAPQGIHIAQWACTTNTSPSQTIYSGSKMPVCAKGNLLLLFLTFPICWDGINLDSPDHKSHTAYPGKRGCPTTHPKRLPNIAFKVAWALANKGSEDYRLSSDMPGMPAGQTIHGDWFESWQPEIKDLWFTNCTSNTADCSVGNLGNGTRLKNPAN